MNWSEFFHMGGYAFYVWGSYLLTFGVIIFEVLAIIRRRQRLAARKGAASGVTKSES